MHSLDSEIYVVQNEAYDQKDYGTTNLWYHEAGETDFDYDSDYFQSLGRIVPGEFDDLWNWERFGGGDWWGTPREDNCVGKLPYPVRNQSTPGDYSSTNQKNSSDIATVCLIILICCLILTSFC